MNPLTLQALPSKASPALGKVVPPAEQEATKRVKKRITRNIVCKREIGR